jgi:hypothetical protein
MGPAISPDQETDNNQDEQQHWSLPTELPEKSASDDWPEADLALIAT